MIDSIELLKDELKSKLGVSLYFDSLYNKIDARFKLLNIGQEIFDIAFIADTSPISFFLEKKTGYIHVIYSYGDISWKYNNTNGRLSYGGGLIFNCDKRINLLLNEKTKVVSMFIPRAVLIKLGYDDKIINILLNINGILNTLDINLINKIYSSIVDDSKNNKYLYLHNIHLINCVAINKINGIVKNNELIRDCIINNIKNGFFLMSIDSISKELHISKNNIIRILNEEHTTLIKLIRKYKLELIAIHIQRNNLNCNIASICYKYGFNRPETASRLFKLKYGMSMSEFKKYFNDN